MRLIRVLASALFSLLLTGQALALTLGHLSIQSKPDQPLKAEITIQFQAGELANLKDLQVALSSPEIYQRLGISSSATQAQLKVSLIKGSKQEPIVVQITSDEVLKLQTGEVFLDALIELRWSAGLVRRAYTLMVGDQAKVQVKGGDTLTEIAARALPQFEDANLDQALIALYRANPQAFAGGSIHRLMAGAELKMPSQAMVKSVPTQEAKDIAVSADQAYRSGQTQLSLAEVTKLNSGSTPGDRLKVGPADGLEGDAKRRMEELLVQEKALTEAKQRIVELEKNIADLKTLIKNSDKKSGASTSTDWSNYAGPLAIGVATLLALLVLLKLSKGQAQRTTTSPEVPPQAAQLLASLDLNLGSPVSAPLPSVETLKVKLNLVRAYITIEDFKAARQALDEVLLVSNQVDPDLTIQAKSLLAEIEQRSA
ncbi:MAG: hypothetical protein E6Q68_02440 [Polynucleobacter sp.]|nr:MAG: hypothetical protein E6Q68_02440 [Polynucleobacter sp.]